MATFAMAVPTANLNPQNREARMKPETLLHPEEEQAFATLKRYLVQNGAPNPKAISRLAEALAPEDAQAQNDIVVQINKAMIIHEDEHGKLSYMFFP